MEERLVCLHSQKNELEKCTEKEKKRETALTLIKLSKGLVHLALS